MTSTARALVALALLGASIVHLAVAASGIAAPVALLLAGIGLAEVIGAALVLRGALGRNPGTLAALLVAPVIVLSGGLAIADLLARPDLVEALTRPALLGAAALAFAGAFVSAATARRLRRADARRAPEVRPGRPALQATLLITAVLATGAVAAPAVASVRPELVPGSSVSTLLERSGDENTGDVAPAPAGAEAEDAAEEPSPFAVMPGHEGHVGYEP